MSKVLRNDQEYQKKMVTREEALCNVNDKIGHQTMDVSYGNVEESRSYKGQKKLVIYHRIVFRLVLDHRIVSGLTFDHWIVLVLLTGPLNEVQSTDVLTGRGFLPT